MGIRSLDDLDLLMTTIHSAAAKLKAAADGPEGSVIAVLTATESKVVYHLLVEQIGLVTTEQY
jgi:hypothetical protein